MKEIATIILSISIVGCAGLGVHNDGNYVEPIGLSKVTTNDTVFSSALKCFGGVIVTKPKLYIAVGEIKDLTGTSTFQSGSKVTNAATDMMITALGKANVPQVERINTTIPRGEIEFAMKKMLGPASKKFGFKELPSGQIRSSDYYIIGSISELNILDVSTTELKIPKLGVGGRTMVINIAMDLRMVKTESMTIYKTVSYQQQLIAREFKNGLFGMRISSDQFVALFQKRQVQPVHLAVRSIVEYATINLITTVYNLNLDLCALEHYSETK